MFHMKIKTPESFPSEAKMDFLSEGLWRARAAASGRRKREESAFSFVARSGGSQSILPPSTTSECCKRGAGDS